MGNRSSVRASWQASYESRINPRPTSRVAAVKCRTHAWAVYVARSKACAGKLSSPAASRLASIRTSRTMAESAGKAHQPVFEAGHCG